jgi:SAM-dependent methyltransferase
MSRSRSDTVVTRDDHDALIQRQFGASADGYRTSVTHARGPSLSRLLALTEPKPHWLVLDVATGAGHTAAALAPMVQLVVAGDMTREMLQQARTASRDRGLDNIRFVRENARTLAHRDATFDLVACRVAAHHFSDPARFVAECARVLKPGGRLALVDNVVPDDAAAARWINDFERQRDASHVRCLSLAQWRQLFSGHELELLHSEVLDKTLDFEDWMRRMNVPPETIDRLGRSLLAAPGAVRSFLRPQTRAERIELTLQEAVLITRLSA